MKPKGLTLIELVIAMAIMSVLLGGAVVSVNALTGAKAKESTTQLAGTIRSLYDTANLSGKTCRLVFDLPGPKDEDGRVSYRAECAEAGVTAGANRDDEIRQARERDRDEAKAEKRRPPPRPQASTADGVPTQVSVQELMQREKDRVEQSAKFSEYTNEEIPPRTLPSGVRLQVWTRKQREPISSGQAYLYFFPQGFTERAQLAIRQGDNVWTLSVAPLTGKTSVVAEALPVPRS